MLIKSTIEKTQRDRTRGQQHFEAGKRAWDVRPCRASIVHVATCPDYPHARAGISRPAPAPPPPPATAQLIDGRDMGEEIITTLSGPH